MYFGMIINRKTFKKKGRMAAFSVKIKKFFKALGPGLITGSSDDDPSGIATYSQAGAKFGLSTLWTALITFPLIAAIQEMCARIGLITSVGLTTTLKNHYSKTLLYLMMVFSVPAIILNIGDDYCRKGFSCKFNFPYYTSYSF